MLTPAFEIVQDDACLKILIKARYAKVSEAEIFIDGKDFKFYSKPYFLRLTLPGSLIEDGRETAKYDVDKGYFTITVSKETRGEYFDGLDMLTKMLAPAGDVSASEPLLEVIDSETTTADICDKEVEDEEEDDIDWQLPQQPFLEDEMAMGGSTYYGFANRRTGVFARLQDELCGMVDLPEPDHMTLPVRRKARQQAEQHKFDKDHYIADFMEDDCIQSVVEFETPWAEDFRKLRSKRDVGVSEADAIAILTDEERDQMIKLPKKQYLLDQKTEASVLLSLVDIVFAYCYDVRTTEGDPCVESSWTICKLSATLSWLDWFGSLDNVIQACFRRSLCYPLYRHWQLNLEVLKDMTAVFYLGRKQLLKCLLNIKRILSQEESRYILNDLYITDYCVWIQSISHAKIRSLSQALEKINIDKSQMNFDLKDLEQMALTIKEESTKENRSDGIDGESYNDSDDSDDDSKDVSDEDSEDESDDDDESSNSSVISDGYSTEEQKSNDIASKHNYASGVEIKNASYQQLKSSYHYGYPNILRSDIGQPQVCPSARDDRELSVVKEQTHKHLPLSTSHSETKDLESHSESGKVSQPTGCEVDQQVMNLQVDRVAVNTISAALGHIVLDSSEEPSDSTLASLDTAGKQQEDCCPSVCDNVGARVNRKQPDGITSSLVDQFIDKPTLLLGRSKVLKNDNLSSTGPYKPRQLTSDDKLHSPLEEDTSAKSPENMCDTEEMKVTGSNEDMMDNQKTFALWTKSPKHKVELFE